MSSIGYESLLSRLNQEIFDIDQLISYLEVAGQYLDRPKKANWHLTCLGGDVQIEPSFYQEMIKPFELDDFQEHPDLVINASNLYQVFFTYFSSRPEILNSIRKHISVLIITENINHWGTGQNPSNFNYYTQELNEQNIYQELPKFDPLELLNSNNEPLVIINTFLGYFCHILGINFNKHSCLMNEKLSNQEFADSFINCWANS